jgi:signal transduction histidine kinase
MKNANDLIIANKQLVFLNEEKEERAAELIIANKELVFQNAEKEKRAAELVIANKELAFQNEEKENRASELIIANKELVFQNKEKEERAAELVIANKELAFQNEEKEKRAAELAVANKELIFQNQEKEERAAELVIANKELAFQNVEKEKRAAELAIANKELVFQNQEKEERAAELILANKELSFQCIEKEKNAAELLLANSELESFSYSVSHDLRAPIRAISAYAKIVSEDYAGKFDEDATQMLNSIVRNSKKMGELIDDLLAFSRLGRKEVTFSQINMERLVNMVVEELTRAKSATINFKVDKLPPAKGDHALIKQVWLNLVSNAIKYSKQRSEINIEIGGYEKDGSVIYYIDDNGAGFDMRYYDKLFGVFQRLHSQSQFEGTGIGLAIVQKIVHRHNGSVWAQSKLDEGSCFYFSLQGINS